MLTRPLPMDSSLQPDLQTPRSETPAVLTPAQKHRRYRERDRPSWRAYPQKQQLRDYIEKAKQHANG